MLTEILAIYAAVVSTASVAIGYFSYKSGGPKLSGTAVLYAEPAVEGVTLQVAVHNRGRGAVTVDSMRLWGSGYVESEEGASFHGVTLGWPLASINAQLPVRIEGNSGARWVSSASLITKELLTGQHIEELSITLLQADGSYLDIPVDISKIEGINPESLPVEKSDLKESSFIPGEWL